MCAVHNTWLDAFASGLGPVSENLGSELNSQFQVSVLRLRPRCPLVILSGCTPGPVYHSHPHVPSEFDTSPMDIAGQTAYNLRTIQRIARSVADAALPFDFSGNFDFLRAPCLLQWVSTKGCSADQFQDRVTTCLETTASAARALGMSEFTSLLGKTLPGELGVFPTGGNVSDRRFLLETFAMYSLEAERHPEAATPAIVRLDVKEDFDDKYFMPYVPGFLVSGGDLLLFSLTAASGEHTAPSGGEQQTRLLLEKLMRLLNDLGCTWEDVVMVWDKVVDLDTNEEAVLMTRSRMRLDRPIAESVLEVDTLGAADDGTPILLEYIVAVQARPTE